MNEPTHSPATLSSLLLHYSFAHATVCPQGCGCRCHSHVRPICVLATGDPSLAHMVADCAVRSGLCVLRFAFCVLRFAFCILRLRFAFCVLPSFTLPCSPVLRANCQPSPSPDLLQTAELYATLSFMLDDGTDTIGAPHAISFVCELRLNSSHLDF